MNEYIPFMNSWCVVPADAPPGEDCDWQSNSSHAVLMNRETLGWSAAAACGTWAASATASAHAEAYREDRRDMGRFLQGLFSRRLGTRAGRLKRDVAAGPIDPPRRRRQPPILSWVRSSKSLAS
jgi:hypothetical protein